MLKIESKVLVGASKVPGVVKELATDSALVAQRVMIDGQMKDIKQWYSLGIVEEVVDKANTYVEAVDIIEQLEKKGLSEQEISELVNKDQAAFKEKCIELGVLPSN